MQTNRRTWLQQIGLGVAGLSIAQLKAFAIPDQSSTHYRAKGNGIRLDLNENPYGPSPLAKVAMADGIINCNRYNWNITSDLISAISKKNNIGNDNILVAAGSTEILDAVVQSLASKNGSFVMANPTFANWAKIAEKSGLKKISIALTVDKKYDLKAMLDAVKHDTKFVYVCNPNNPTGTISDREALISFITEATKKTTVLVDEAYLDYTDQISVSNLVSGNKNLIVVKTFSKIYGLAGARIGYAMAHVDTIAKISQLQSWANGSVGVVSRVGAIASLKDDDFVKQCKDKNEAARKYTIDQLTKLDITCIPSHTNFIYFSLLNYKKDFFPLLKSNDIQGTGIYEEAGKWTRITVGTMEEMQMFIEAIK